WGEGDRLVGVAVLWARAEAFWDIIRREGHERAGPNSYVSFLDEHGVRIGHSSTKMLQYSPAGPLDEAEVREMVREKRFGDDTEARLRDVKPFPEQFERARAAEPDRGLFQRYARANDQVNFGVATRLETAPWTLFVMVPRRDLTAPLDKLFLQVLFLCVPVILLP